MKWLLVFWAGPILILGTWYGLSSNDMSFGIFMLTRQAHDMVFQVYGNLLGIEPETIPPLVARAIVVDSAVLFSLVAFRRRAKILAWWRGGDRQDGEATSLASPDSLSRAP